MKSFKTALVCMVATFALHAFALDTKTTETKTTSTPATSSTEATHAVSAHEQMMAEMMKLGQPSQGHKQLEAYAGKWDHTVTMWMDPKAKPQTMKGTSENTMVMGGRFLHQTSKGEAQQGMPAFEGMGYTGYDNITGQYNSFWMDNLSTSMMKASATFDAKAKALNETGTYVCPVAKKELPFRAKWAWTGKNTYKYEMFTTDPATGKEFKSMEIAYKRAK